MSSDVLRESWANVSATLSPEFSSAIAGLVVSNLDGLKDFICFLTSRKDASSTRVLAAMQGNADALDNTSFQSYSLAFHQAANQWITNGLQATPTQAASTRRSRVAIGCTALRRLSQSGVSCIPYIADGQLRVPVHRQGEDEGHRPLGEAEWCELKDIPADGRNKIALDLLRAEYVRILENYFKLFDYGERILSDQDFYSRSREGAELIRTALEMSLRLHRKNAAYLLPNERTSPEESSHFRTQFARQLRSPGLWMREAEVDLKELGVNDKFLVRRLLHACLGPPLAAVSAAMGFFACETYWNKQPIIDLPADPLLFKSSENWYIGTENFLASFKSRRNAHVYAYITDDDEISGNKLESAQGIYTETVKNYDPDQNNDGHAIIKSPSSSGHMSLAFVLNKFAHMRKVVLDRHKDICGKSHPDAGSFWLTINHLGKVVTPREYTGSTLEREKDYGIESIASRPECTYPAIRTTGLQLSLGDLSTVSNVRAVAQHNGYGVLMPHYLNSSIVNAKLDAAVRDFQYGIEAIVSRSRTLKSLSLCLDRSSEELMKSYHFTKESGLFAALGLEAPRSSPDGITFSFVPSRPNLEELFLAHWALTKERTETRNLPQFTVLHLPALGIVKAIGRQVCAKGLSKFYWQAARAVNRPGFAGGCLV